MKAVLLVNVGTPDSPQVPDVRRFLSQFLNDPHVIDLPWLARKLLVNGIIVPFRAPKSARLYQKLWTASGSPLLVHLLDLQRKLQAVLQEDYVVYAAMRYGKPELTEVLAKINQQRYSELILIPLFPQYATSTAGSVIDAVVRLTKQWKQFPTIRVVEQFYSHPAFIQSFVQRIQSYQPHEYAHILFSYHGLPLSQVQKNHPNNEVSGCMCELAMPSHGTHCYLATCYATTRLLATALQLPEGSYSTAFQSRLTKKWLQPFSDKEVTRLAQAGCKRLLVISPSFVADCLETLVEIGEEYVQLFKQSGGEECRLVESLNSSNDWVKALAEIITAAEPLNASRHE